MSSPVGLQIPGASALGAQTWGQQRPGSVSSSAGTPFLTACLPGNTGSSPHESSQKSPPMEPWANLSDRIAADLPAPLQGKLSQGGFRQTPLTWSTLVLVAYVFLISDSAICHESLTIRIVRRLTKSCKWRNEITKFIKSRSLFPLLVHPPLGGTLWGIRHESTLLPETCKPLLNGKPQELLANT